MSEFKKNIRFTHQISFKSRSWHVRFTYVDPVLRKSFFYDGQICFSDLEVSFNKPIKFRLEKMLEHFLKYLSFVAINDTVEGTIGIHP